MYIVHVFDGFAELAIARCSGCGRIYGLQYRVCEIPCRGVWKKQNMFLSHHRVQVYIFWNKHESHSGYCQSDELEILILSIPNN